FAGFVWMSANGPHKNTRLGSQTNLMSQFVERLWIARKEKSVQSWHRCLVFCHHLITLSALAKTLGGIMRPICLAAFRLIMNSNFIAASTGRSAGLAPLRILSTYTAARRYLTLRSEPYDIKPPASVQADNVAMNGSLLFVVYSAILL